MAGRVLRDSKGRFKGSTRGFGAGRRLRTASPGVKAAVNAGAGTLLAAGGFAAIHRGIRTNNPGLIALGGGLNVGAKVAYSSAGLTGARAAQLAVQKRVTR